MITHSYRRPMLTFPTRVESSLIVSRAIAIEYSIFEKVDRTTGNDYRSRTYRRQLLAISRTNAQR